MRRLGGFFADLRSLEERIAEVTREIEASAAQDERSRRLMTVPEFARLVATAIIASAGDANRPVPTSTGYGGSGRACSTRAFHRRQDHLLGISRRGNRYLLKPIGPRCSGPVSCISIELGLGLAPGPRPEQRMHTNKVTVALATKLARVAWVILIGQEQSDELREPLAA